LDSGVPIEMRSAISLMLEPNKMLQPSLYDDLPKTVLAAFENRTMLSALEVARLLEIDPKTLQKLIANGEIEPAGDNRPLR
jgi:hypothetical protein